MEKPDFEKVYQEFSEKVIVIGDIKNPMEVMRQMLELPKFFEGLWLDGYAKGFKEGRKIEKDYIKTNN